MANTVDASKVNAYAYTAPDPDKIVVSKLNVYLWLMPGTEPEPPTPSLQTGFTYAQIPRVLTYPASTIVFGKILVSGDMQDGTDALSLSGDMQSGGDDEQYSYEA